MLQYLWRILKSTKRLLIRFNWIPFLPFSQSNLNCLSCWRWNAQLEVASKYSKYPPLLIIVRNITDSQINQSCHSSEKGGEYKAPCLSIQNSYLDLAVWYSIIYLVLYLLNPTWLLSTGVFVTFRHSLQVIARGGYLDVVCQNPKLLVFTIRAPSSVITIPPGQCSLYPGPPYSISPYNCECLGESLFFWNVNVRSLLFAVRIVLSRTSNLERRQCCPGP